MAEVIDLNFNIFNKNSIANNYFPFHFPCHMIKINGLFSYKYFDQCRI